MRCRERFIRTRLHSWADMAELTKATRRAFLASCLASAAAAGGAARAVLQSEASPQELAKRAKVAGFALSKLRRWLHQKALPLIDAQTGLYRADGRWNYRDTAADCYPFLCWAAYVTDPAVLTNEALAILEAEQRLCNHIDRIPVRFDWKTRRKATDLSWEHIVFGASEYVKDGLIAIVELLGRGPWFERMKAIEDDIWKHAPIDTPYGPIPSRNVEVNGEQLQALARLWAATEEERYGRWALRLAHYYLDDENYAPRRLRDHGCEIIGGLGLLLGVLSERDHPELRWLTKRLQKMFDLILARGCNPDGLMYNTLGDPRSGLSDNWGYNYIAFHCFDMASGQHRYRAAIEHVLRAIDQPEYYGFNWGGGIDGFADSIEGALYLVHRFQVAEALRWIDREVKQQVLFYNVPGAERHLWGTMKLESNAVRTVVMYTLMLTGGVLPRPWQDGLEIGALRNGSRLALWLRSDKPWRGRLQFDQQRHRRYFGFQRDWPRLNTVPEWFAVDERRTYVVRGAHGSRRTVTGRQLIEGVPAEAGPQPIVLSVQSA